MEMRTYLERCNGFQTVGIFRKAPNADECDRIKVQLDKGDWMIPQGCDVQVMANLIKVWFRDLPIPILEAKGIDQQDIKNAQNTQSASDTLTRFPEPERLYYNGSWICVLRSQDTKMLTK